MSTAKKISLAAIAVVALAVLVGFALVQRSGPQRTQGPGSAVEATPVSPPRGAEGKAAPGASQALEAKGKEAKWFTSLPDALAAAQQTRTLILVDAYAEWCGWCKKLEKETFSDPTVRARMQKFTLLRIDTDKQPEVAQRYGVTGLPTTLILNAKGELVLNQAGFMPPKDYLELLARAEKHAS